MLRYLRSAESGTYVNPSKAHYKMALRCLSFLQFRCFNANLTDEDITSHIKRGEYLWLEYAESSWLEHVRSGSNVEPDMLHKLNCFLQNFLVYWRREYTSTGCNPRKLNIDFGLTAFRELSPEVYQTLVQSALYKSQGKSSGYVKGKVLRFQFMVITKVWIRSFAV